jgi:hypothetical protein
MSSLRDLLGLGALFHGYNNVIPPGFRMPSFLKTDGCSMVDIDGVYQIGILKTLHSRHVLLLRELMDL